MVDVGIALNLASGVLLAAVGVWVLTIRPRRRGNVAFAVFVISYGLRPVPANLAYKLGLAPDLNLALATLLALVATAALLALAFSFPRPLAREDRPALVVASLAGTALALVVATAALAFDVGGTSQDSRIELVQTLAFALLNTVTGAVLVLLPLRYHAALPEETLLRRQLALVAAALLSIFAFMATAGWSENASLLALAHANPAAASLKVAEIALTLLAIGLWLRNTARAGETRLARNVAIYAAAVLLVGLLYAATDLHAGGHGIARVAAMLILAVAISRFQLLDVDVKLRRGVRSGTIAAAFVGVFFVASELAQQLFEDATGSAFFGIAIAGILVFAMAPLQRAAERIAAAAVPPAYEGAHAPADAAAAYRSQVQIAWRDGRISPKEILMLRELRAYLRLPPDLAERIEAEVARDLPP